MLTRETYKAYEIYREIAPDIILTANEFEDSLRALHTEYMQRQFTIGKMADLLGVPVLNLYDILEAAGLPTRTS
jgi:hypothetical protein